MMPIFHYSNRSLSKVAETTFSIEEMREREDLQAALKKNISAISDDLLVISEEFCVSEINSIQMWITEVNTQKIKIR